MAADAAAGKGPIVPGDTIDLDPNRGLGGRGAEGYGGGTDTPGLRPIVTEGAGSNDVNQADVEALATEGYAVTRTPVVPEGEPKPAITRGVPGPDVETGLATATVAEGTLRVNRWRLPYERTQGSQGQRVGDDRR